MRYVEDEAAVVEQHPAIGGTTLPRVVGRWNGRCHAKRHIARSIAVQLEVSLTTVEGHHVAGRPSGGTQGETDAALVQTAAGGICTGLQGDIQRAAGQPGRCM
ncbi:hypothetical protein D3C78_1214350 [compost metagenome]